MRVMVTADPELPVPPRLYGGIERIIDVLVRRLRGLGFEVGLCAHAESTCPADRLFPWPAGSSRGGGSSLANLRALKRAVRAWRPAVLHGFSRLAYLLPLLPRPLPKIMSYQREPNLRTTTWARRFSRGTLTFTGCSESICRIGRRGGGDWRAIHNFVETERFAYSATVPSDAPLVFLSRVERIKGAHTAIEIARRSGRRLIIAGNRAETGSEADYFRMEIEPHLGRDGVEYVGPVDDGAKIHLLTNAAAMLVPIEWEEPFGIVFAESLACGTPVISCPRGALPEIVENGVHGYLIEGIDDGVRAVEQVAGISREACRRRAEEHFSADAIVKRYVALYEELAFRTSTRRLDAAVASQMGRTR
jgi:glycosyltransferase involved in cell wall biosynthesis